MKPARSCQRYEQLTLEARDRNLTAEEEQFVADHRSACSMCADRLLDSTKGLDLLASLDMPVEDSLSDERRIVRLVKLDTARRSWSVLSPAIIGLGIGLVLMLGTLQLLAAPEHSRTVVPFGEARRIQDRLPELPEVLPTTP